MTPTHPIDSTNSTMMPLEELSQLASQLQESIATVQNMVMTTREEIESLSQKQKIRDARLATIDKQLTEIQGRKLPRQVRNLSPEIREIEKNQELAKMKEIRKIIWISVAMLQAVCFVFGIIFITVGAPMWPFAVCMVALMLAGFAFDPLFRQCLKQQLYDCLASCGLSGQLEALAK